MLFTVTESPPRSHIQVKRGLIKNWPSPAAAAAACARFTQFLTNKSTRLSTFIRCYLCLYYGGKMCYFSVSRHANVSPFHGYIGLWKPLAAPLISRSPLSRNAFLQTDRVRPFISAFSWLLSRRSPITICGMDQVDGDGGVNNGDGNKRCRRCRKRMDGPCVQSAQHYIRHRAQTYFQLSPIQ